MVHRQQAVGKTDEWYTPAHVFDALGCTFDMDIASPGRDVTPWIPARTFIQHSGLEIDWVGTVWMNPPFGGRGDKAKWLSRFFDHGNGIALVPDRTSAPWWQQFAPMADLVLFVAPKIKFIGGEGQPNESPAQGTCLLSANLQGPLIRAAACGLGKLMRPCT